MRVCVCPNEPLFASNRVDESALYVVVYKLAYINSFVTFFFITLFNALVWFLSIDCFIILTSKNQKWKKE